MYRTKRDEVDLSAGLEDDDGLIEEGDRGVPAQTRANAIALAHDLTGRRCGVLATRAAVLDVALEDRELTARREATRGRREENTDARREEEERRGDRSDEEHGAATLLAATARGGAERNDLRGRRAERTHDGRIDVSDGRDHDRRVDPREHVLHFAARLLIERVRKRKRRLDPTLRRSCCCAAPRRTLSICCGDASLLMCATAPTASARSRMPGSSVRKTIDVLGRSGLSSRATSSPVFPGIELSRRIRSGLSSSAFSTPSAPSTASPTTTKSPSGARRERIPSRIARWSSTMSTRVANFFPVLRPRPLPWGAGQVPVRPGTGQACVFGVWRTSDRGRTKVVGPCRDSLHTVRDCDS